MGGVRWVQSQLAVHESWRRRTGVSLRNREIYLTPLRGGSTLQCFPKVRALCDGFLLAEIEMHDKGRARREGR